MFTARHDFSVEKSLLKDTSPFSHARESLLKGTPPGRRRPGGCKGASRKEAGWMAACATIHPSGLFPLLQSDAFWGPQAPEGLETPQPGLLEPGLYSPGAQLLAWLGWRGPPPRHQFRGGRRLRLGLKARLRQLPTSELSPRSSCQKLHALALREVPGPKGPGTSVRASLSQHLLSSSSLKLGPY